MAETMRERIARALCFVTGTHCYGTEGCEAARQCRSKQPKLLRETDAVLAAMEEPTEAMCEAAIRSTAGWLNLPEPGTAMTTNLRKAAHRYRAMIRAAREGH